MIKKLLITCLFIFAGLLSNAQPGKEAWHWNVGTKSTIDFSSGTAISGTATPAWFSSVCGASVSDMNTGQFLFCIQANRIFDKNNATMSNGSGLFGDSHATQELIVPKPDSANIYYVISTDKAVPGNLGIHYSVVDMTKQGGLGQVTIKNQILTPHPTTGKVTAIRHCNGTDYWILTHPGNSNSFNAYLLTSSGINSTPIVSNTGTVEQFLTTDGYQNNEGQGQLKASPNGKKIALGILSDTLPLLEIFDFDNSTGIVNNPITINYNGMTGPCGLSFSPDNSKLYAAPWDTVLYQYDLSSNIPSVIIASQTLIAYTADPHAILEMQMAPDGKIYMSRYYSDTLAVINNPNNPGISCNFQNQGFVLQGPSNWAGLPNFIDANYAGIQINIPDLQLCNTFTSQTLDAGAGFVNYSWSTGASTQTISVNSPGKYWVTVTSVQGCTKTDTVNAYLLKPLREDTIYCGSSFTANVTQSGVLAYNWFDGNTNPIRNFTQSGNYYVDINYVGGCAVRDSIHLKIFPSASVNIGPDTTYCLGNLRLNAENQKAGYLWSTGETSQNIIASKAGTYWVVITDTNGCKAADTMIVRPQLSAFDFQMPNIVTPNDDKINDVIDFGIYQFSSLQIGIYNRWGQKVFESSDPKGIWKPAVDDGTYFYTAQYKIECGAASDTKSIKGFITIVR
jgi:hypothetical protein